MSRARLVNKLFDEVHKRGDTITRVCKKAGLSESTVRSWRRHEPLLGNFIALVEASGGKVELHYNNKNEKEKMEQDFEIEREYFREEIEALRQNQTNSKLLSLIHI